jgi:hypothetical protein
MLLELSVMLLILLITASDFTISVPSNYDKSAAIFCGQVAAWVTDAFCNFLFGETSKMLIPQQPLKLRGKNDHKFRILIVLDIS